MSQDNMKLPCREEICRDGCVLMLCAGQGGPGKIWLGLSPALPHLMSLLRLPRVLQGREVFDLHTTPMGGPDKRYRLSGVLEAKVVLDGAGNENPRVTVLWRADDQTEMGRRVWGQKTKGRSSKEPKEGTARFSPLGEEAALVVGGTEHERNREELAGAGGRVPHWLCRSTMDEDGPFRVK